MRNPIFSDSTGFTSFSIALYGYFDNAQIILGIKLSKNRILRHSDEVKQLKNLFHTVILRDTAVGL